MQNIKVGFIGQGMVGKNMADNFTDRGFEVVRYSLEPEYVGNKDLIKTCDLVFIAVPTPTTPKGFDDSILRKEIKLVGEGKTVVIKSTVLPGTTESIQRENPEIFVLHSPEFLVASKAREGTDNPERNLIGLPKDTPEYQAKADFSLSVLPNAPYTKILLSKETELIKYIGNNFLHTKVVFMNLMYDIAEKIGADWKKVSEAVVKDPRIGSTHMNPVHASIDGRTKPGRGSGGSCFPKDFEALTQFYKDNLSDPKGVAMLKAISDKNIELLKNSGKDADVLKAVYNI